MKTELEQQDIDTIANRIAELLIPQLRENNPDEDTILDVNSAADFLKTTKQQIYQWVDNAKYGKGNFPFFKAGRLLRFSKAELLCWLKNKNCR